VLKFFDNEFRLLINVSTEISIKKTELDQDKPVLTVIIGKINKVKKPNINFLSGKLQKFALDVSGRTPLIVYIPNERDIMSDENKRKIPLGILAIKFFQLCKKLGIGTNNALVASPEVPAPAAPEAPVLDSNQRDAVRYLVSDDFKSYGKAIPKGLSERQYELYIGMGGKPVGGYETGKGLSLEDVKSYSEKSKGGSKTHKRKVSKRKTRKIKN
jgi:hypothetical protein